MKRLKITYIPISETTSRDWLYLLPGIAYCGNENQKGISIYWLDMLLWIHFV